MKVIKLLFHKQSLQTVNTVHDTSFISRDKVYWIYQISGWILYALLNILANFVFDKLTFSKALSFVILSTGGLVTTHIIRGIIKQNNWISLPLSKIIVNVVLSSILAGIVLYIIYYEFNVAVGIEKLNEFKPAAPFVLISNLSIIIFAWLLIYFSVHLFNNYRRAEIESLIWEAAVKDFELKTLKSQLNPHFMFNAMNSIRALIEEDPESAKTAVTKLSNILRYSLKIERTETVPLEEEMQTVEDYLALEAIRYEERLAYNISIDPKSKKIEIPPMMIQTLVENGIKHGISKKKEGGSISISSKLENDKLTILITNSGSVTDEDIKHSTGFGLNNTKHRLNLLYSDQGTFRIYNKNNNEVSAEIIIPSGGKINESFNN